ncbi:hypothetical protein [Parasediminibacterium sp. JCM 36343]|uniref:hypothetical protein n=1 Tax=Parasediminibacterium sp. JCM 36343 TaxID=3374279 RepID=UPI00397AF212
MKILVFGNIASGKTTVVRRLKEEYSFQDVSIDNYRRKYGDGSSKGEALARIEFYHTAGKKGDNLIIECLGVGEVADKLCELLYESKERIICLILLVKKEVCLSRLSRRKWDVPFPHLPEKIYSLIENTQLKIEAAEIESKWNKIENITFVSKINNNRYDLEMIISEMKYIIKEVI